MKTNETLARRWLASKHWGGWRLGMVAEGGRVCAETPTGNLGLTPFSGKEGVPAELKVRTWHNSHSIPDLDHPGTRAFLLEDVRRAWGDPHVHPSNFLEYTKMVPGPMVWSVSLWVAVPDGLDIEAPTEAAALIAALEAAP